MSLPQLRLLRPVFVGVRLAMCLVLPLALAACATPAPKPPPYIAPAGAPTAKLVMRGSVPSGNAFGVLVYDDADQCKGPRVAGAGNATRNPSTIALAAGALTTLDFVLITTSKQACAVRWSFTPEAGKSYLVAGAAFGTSCTARLLDASNPDAMRSPAGLVRRNSKGNACLPIAQSRAVGGAVTQGGQSDGAAVLNPNAGAEDLQGLIGK
jgi:hypothetical protein